MVFLMYKIGIFIALHLPLRAGYALAAFLARMYAFFSKKDREAIQENLRILFPNYETKKIKAIRSRIFVNFGKYLVDFFRLSLIDKDYINRYVKIEGRHFLDQALAKGKGAILSSAHLGNWELGGVVLAAIGIPLDVVALNHKQDKVNRFFTEQRTQKGVGVIPVGVSVRRCFKSLSSNRCVALVGDRDYFDNGLLIEFFGKKTIIPKGPALFSRRCNSPIIPVYMVRNNDDTFTLKITEPIESKHTKDEHDDLISITKNIVKVIEDMARKYPEQWFVFRRFWEKIGWAKEKK
jgi:lauroyl/myristoyl acyltransferase